MKDLSNLISEKNYQEATNRLKKICREQKKRVLLKKIMCPVSGILFTILMFLGIVDMMKGYDDTKFLDGIGKATVGLHDLILKVVGADATWYLILVGWLVLAIVIPIVFTLITSIILTFALLAKEEPVLEGTEKEMGKALLDRVKCYQFIWVEYSDYGNAFAGIFTGAIFAFLIWGMIKYDAFALEVSFLVGMAACIAVLFFLYKLLYGISFAICKLFFGSNYCYGEIHSVGEKLTDMVQEMEQEEARIEKEKREKKEREQARKKANAAEKRYEEAMKQDDVDEDVVLQAAKDGSPSACLHVGRQLYMEMLEARSKRSRTQDEMKDMYDEAVGYLEISAEKRMVEAEFLMLSLDVQTQSHTLEGWKNILKDLRRFEKSEELKNYRDAMEQMTGIVVETIDELAESERQRERERNRKPVIKREYCRYNNAGVCGYYSNSVYLAKCDYMTNPGQCAAALNNKGLAFEFE